MRRLLFTVAATAMLAAIAPASALARGHHRHHSRHHSRHHARIRHERFGSLTGSMDAGSSETAGTVMSFSGGTLTIRLNDGSTVDGRVTSNTELECEAAQPMQAFDDNGGATSGDDTATAEDNDVADDNAAGEDNDVEDENEAAENCTTADLTPGTVVREAELNVSSAGAVWHQVELVV